jgi:hypothetical protein
MRRTDVRHLTGYGVNLTSQGHQTNHYVILDALALGVQFKDPSPDLCHGLIRATTDQGFEDCQ